jgi:CRP/FNR family cyclic AMP-dependent transcriptional regulator
MPRAKQIIILQMLESIRRFPLFADLTQTDLEVIAPLFELRLYPAGATFIKQGDKAVCLYLLLSGKVTVRYKPYDGEMINLNDIQAGGVCGWSAVLGNPVYSSSVVCNTPCETLVVAGKDLRTLELKYPETAHTIINKLADAVSTRWEDAHNQVKSMLKKGIAENISPLRRET